MQNLKALIERLTEGGVEFVVVGGYAALSHGSSIMTQDVDICCPFSQENLTRLAASLEGLHPVHRLTPQKMPLLITPELFPGLKNMYLKTDWGVLDCLSEVLGVGAYETVRTRSVAVDTPLGKCRILGIKALIEAKEAMGRQHDLLTVIQLRAIEEKSRKS